MSDRDEADRLSECDQELFDQIDEFIASPNACAGSPDPSTRLLVDLTRSAPRADDAFRLRLRQRLVAEHRRVATMRSGRFAVMIVSPRLRSTWLKPGILAAAAVLGLMALAVGVAVGQGRLPHVIPIEMATPPAILSEGQDKVYYPTNVATNEELQRLVSFPLLVPSDLPSKCSGPYQRAYEPAAQEAMLVYQCVSIGERRGDRVIGPIANPGTVEDVLVNGKPAIYFEQTVVHVSVWTPVAITPTVDKLVPPIPEPAAEAANETLPTLIFEQGGVIVSIEPVLNHGPRQAAPPGKADLIRIAESMRPLHAVGR